MRWPRRAAHLAIRFYQFTLSALVGRHCRHFPSCSEYTDEAIQKHGLWAGGWMGFARICRCGPRGTSGIDWVCEELPAQASALTPWRYGLWRGTNDPTVPGSEAARQVARRQRPAEPPAVQRQSPAEPPAVQRQSNE